MIKVWTWIKKFWKWLLIPLAVMAIFLLWLFGWRKSKDDADSGTPDEVADRAVSGIIEAGDKRDQAMKELEHKYIGKLTVMTDEQRAEYEEIRKKPIEEIAVWIDNL